MCVVSISAEALNDKFIAFPVKLFSCKGTNGTKRHDLIAPRPARRRILRYARLWYNVT